MALFLFNPSKMSIHTGVLQVCLPDFDSVLTQCFTFEQDVYLLSLEFKKRGFSGGVGGGGCNMFLAGFLFFFFFQVCSLRWSFKGLDWNYLSAERLPAHISLSNSLCTFCTPLTRVVLSYLFTGSVCEPVSAGSACHGELWTRKAMWMQLFLIHWCFLISAQLAIQKVYKCWPRWGERWVVSVLAGWKASNSSTVICSHSELQEGQRRY